MGSTWWNSWRPSLARTFRAPCRIRPQTLDIAFARDERRGQHYSTAILQRLEQVADAAARVLAVTSATSTSRC